MADNEMFPVSGEWAKRALVDPAAYERLYAQSVANPDAFWGEQGKRIDWIRPYTKVKNTTFGPPDVSIKWYEDGTLNVSANCVDRHLPTRANQTAIIWKAMTRQRAGISLMLNCTARSAALPMC